MKTRRRLAPALIALACAALAGCASPEMRFLGRVSPGHAGEVFLQWPGSGFETAFNGAWLTARITDPGGNWLEVEADGASSRLELKPGTHTYALFQGSPGRHTVRVARRTGANSGMTRIETVSSDGRLEATPAPTRRMMVIGDSMASGFGVEGDDETCIYSPATQNHEAAFGALAARRFGADLHSVSIDGAGLVRNQWGEGPTLQERIWDTLPAIPEPWKAAAYSPQAVVINVGVTDFEQGDPGPAFDEAYIGMLKDLRAAYPDAVIIGAFGAMLDGDRYTAARESIREAVAARADAGDSKVRFLEFDLTDGPRRWGCAWHPGLDAQQDMARQIETVLIEDLDWY
jgi:hypothetical protein